MGLLTPLELTDLLKQQIDARAMLPHCERKLARWESEFGADHPATCRVRCNLARVLLAAGRPEEALALSQAAYDTLCAELSPGHAWTAAAAVVRDAVHITLYMAPELPPLAPLVPSRSNTRHKLLDPAFSRLSPHRHPLGARLHHRAHRLRASCDPVASRQRRERPHRRPLGRTIGTRLR